VCVDHADPLFRELEQVTCWDCGQEFKVTGLSIDGKPVCKKCSIHYSLHLKFDPRCALCRLEKRMAQKDSLRLEDWQQTRQEKETKNASNCDR